MIKKKNEKKSKDVVEVIEVSRSQYYHKVEVEVIEVFVVVIEIMIIFGKVVVVFVVIVVVAVEVVIIILSKSNTYYDKCLKK